MLQCIAVCCSVIDGERVMKRYGVKRVLLQRVAVCCSVMQCAAVQWIEHNEEIRCKESVVAACCSVLQCNAVCCSVLQCNASSTMKRYVVN